MRVKELFFPKNPPTQKQMESGRRCVIVEGAVAAVIYSTATGNFLAGYLSWLGASISLCAAIAMIPQFGCVLQFISPFVFERLHYRKLAVWLLCVIFRSSVTLMFLVPLLFGVGNLTLPMVLVLYVLAFFAAGVVTPGLQYMVLALAPTEHRGIFFARKDIIATCVNGAGTLLLGRQLDYFTTKGVPETGYLILGGVCLLLTVLDAVLLANVHEHPSEYAASVRPKDIMRPVRDKTYRPLLFYIVMGGFISGVAAPFLSAYQLRVLGLSHTFITTGGAVAAVAGMIGSWLWGRYADHTTWTRIMRLCSVCTLCCTLAWAFIIPAPRLLAPILMILTAACSGAAGTASMNLQYACSPNDAKTTYISITSALASIAACASAAVSTTLQPLLQKAMGDHSITVLFFISGAAGLVNLAYNWRKLPTAK